MIIKSNYELSKTIDKLITESGMKRTYISDKLGIKNQNLKRFIYKDNLSLDDAKKILEIIGYKSEIIISKKD